MIFLQKVAFVSTICSLIACGRSFPHIKDTNCADDELKAVGLRKSLKPNIVRVLTDAGTSGSGFIIGKDPHSNALLVVTNFHVIAPGKEIKVERSIQVETFVEEDNPAKVDVLEVAKVDQRHDLALLRIPHISQGKLGITINTRRLEPGQRIAVLGFPFIGYDSATLTVETGSVATTQRETSGEKFVQINANINPGNSGGPLLDACGSASGIVVASITNAKGAHLVIPSERLVTLYRRYAATPLPPERQVRDRLDDFFSVIKYRQEDEVRSYISNDFRVYYVLSVVGHSSVLTKLMETISVYQEAGTKDEAIANMLSKEKEFMDSVLINQSLSDVEQHILHFYYHTLQGHQEKAMEILDEDILPVLPDLGQKIIEHMQGIASYRIDRIEVLSSKSAKALVEVRTSEGVAHQVYLLKIEWGDWRIALID